MELTYTEAEQFYSRASLSLNLLAAQEGFARGSIGELSLLCDKHSSDKGSIDWRLVEHPYKWLPHTYAQAYEILTARMRESAAAVFECGIGSPDDPQTQDRPGIRDAVPAGASLRVWRDYFPQAQVWGADIDKAVLFEEERIKTGYMDQTSPAAIKEFFESTGVSSFDFMVDDGLHTAKAALTLFEYASPYLGESGLYAIEDMPPQDLITLQAELMKYRGDFEVRFLIMAASIFPDNNLVLIRRRKGIETNQSYPPPA
ncbi:MAG: hypothetical protein IJ228_08290 [Succinivibrio sp.]|nr:hypothetical protein [Succinivibrio sp.]